jgi:flagellar biosynthesis protein FliR
MNSKFLGVLLLLIASILLLIPVFSYVSVPANARSVLALLAGFISMVAIDVLLPEPNNQDEDLKSQ